MMNKLQKELEKLKSIVNNPKLYLINYFCNLKQDVCLTKIKQLEKNANKYLEIINKIELFEQDCLNSIKSFSVFKEEIENFNEINMKSIDDMNYKIEKELFNNKSIHFMKDYGKENKTFLLIINDEYVRMNRINNLNESEYFNRENLIAYFLNQKLNSSQKMKITNVISLNIELKNQTSIDMKNYNLFGMKGKIKYIDEYTFNGLVNLKCINFSNNQIKKLHASTFNGLTSLEKISFINNGIQELDSNTFNGLKSLKYIWLKQNEIKKLDSTIFNGLTKLKLINFSYNQIKEVNSSLFRDLTNIWVINFQHNQIRKHKYLCLFS